MNDYKNKRTFAHRASNMRIAHRSILHGPSSSCRIAKIQGTSLKISPLYPHPHCYIDSIATNISWISGRWLPLWKIWKSVGMKNVPNHQPANISWICIAVVYQPHVSWDKTPGTTRRGQARALCSIHHSTTEARLRKIGRGQIRFAWRGGLGGPSVRFQLWIRSNSQTGGKVKSYILKV